MKATITVPVGVARWLLDNKGAQFKVASLYQTMGPHYREIIWIGRSPYTSPTHTVRQIKASDCQKRVTHRIRKKDGQYEHTVHGCGQAGD